MVESGLSTATCCAQTSDSAEDPLIEACDSDPSTSQKAFTFSSDTCTSITTTTTIFRDALGDELAIRVETGEPTTESDKQLCCDAATDSSSDLLFACIPTTEDINEEYTYDEGNEDCMRTFDVKSTYKNSAEIMRIEVTEN